MMSTNLLDQQVADQMTIIRHGVAEIVPEEELVKKAINRWPQNEN